MSTDTDRMVNFCASFHQFWSLPAQVGVALFLLHAQVGVAFLAGLGFALLLIPVNRWLAQRIGSLSASLMAQKDARVKVSLGSVLRGQGQCIEVRVSAQGSGSVLRGQGQCIEVKVSA